MHRNASKRRQNKSGGAIETLKSQGLSTKPGAKVSAFVIIRNGQDSGRAALACCVCCRRRTKSSLFVRSVVRSRCRACVRRITKTYSFRTLEPPTRLRGRRCQLKEQQPWHSGTGNGEGTGGEHPPPEERGHTSKLPPTLAARPVSTRLNSPPRPRAAAVGWWSPRLGGVS